MQKGLEKHGIAVKSATQLVYKLQLQKNLLTTANEFLYFNYVIFQEQKEITVFHKRNAVVTRN